jgi:hypothetical protein
MQTPGYAQQRDRLGTAHDLGKEINRLREALQSLNRREQAELQKVRTPLPGQLLKAREALLRGSARQFARELSTTILDKRTIIEAEARARESAEGLRHAASTIRGISYYTEIATWPLTPDDHARISRIYENYVFPILGKGPSIAVELDRDVLASTIVDLRKTLRATVQMVWGDLPDPEAMADAQDRTAAGISREAQFNRLATQEALDRASNELSGALSFLAAGPRLTESFAFVAEARRVDASKSIAPDQSFIELALRSITSGTVKLVNGDIYIGTHVAAMGPFASADNTTLHGG